MTMQKAVVRIDATYGLAVKVGDEVTPGDFLSRTHAAQGSYASPVHGTIEDIRLDGDKHEFVVLIAPARTP